MHAEKAARLDGFAKPTVWEEFTGLANKHQSVNLGQGFPGWNSLQFVKDALVSATLEENANQYSRPAGDLVLTAALSRHYSPLFFPRSGSSPICFSSTSQLQRCEPLDPLTEITICNGASQAIYAVLQAFVQGGDEVVVFEPAFDLYAPQVQMAGGRCVYVSILPPSVEADGGPGLEREWEWRLDVPGLCAAVTEATRMIIVNSPHNPTGYRFSAEDCRCIDSLCARFPRLLILADEVYENLCYGDARGQGAAAGEPDREHLHLRIAAQSERLFARTVTVSSAGKTFSATGWKIGWCLGPRELVRGVCLVNQWVQFSVCSAAQRAVGRMLDTAAWPCAELESGELVFGDDPAAGAVRHRHYYAYLLGMYRRKRDLLLERLRPLAPFIQAFQPRGTFFVVCNISKFMSVYDRAEVQSGAEGVGVGGGGAGTLLSFRDYLRQHKAGSKTPGAGGSGSESKQGSPGQRPLPPRPATPGAGFMRRMSMSLPASPSPTFAECDMSSSPSPSPLLAPVMEDPQQAARTLRYTEDDIDDSLLLTPEERGGGVGVRVGQPQPEEDDDDEEEEEEEGAPALAPGVDRPKKAKLPLFAKLAPKFIKDKLRYSAEKKLARKQAKAEQVLLERQRLDARMEASCSHHARSAAIKTRAASAAGRAGESLSCLPPLTPERFLREAFRLARVEIAMRRVRGLTKAQLRAATEEGEEEEEVKLDWHFCRWLSIHVGVAAIPVSAFYTAASRAAHSSSDRSNDYHLIRLCFAKPDDVLLAACDRLAKCVS